MLSSILVVLSLSCFFLQVTATSSTNTKIIGRSSISRIVSTDSNNSSNFFGCEFNMAGGVDYSDLQSYFNNQLHTSTSTTWRLEQDIYQALLLCKVLVFRRQGALSVEHQRELTRFFGDLQVHLESSSHLPGYEDVNVVSNIKNTTGAYTGLYGKHVENFHSDISWADVPTKITVLKSEIRPEGCGQTEFLDTHSAYDALDEEFRAQLLPLTASYCYLKLRDVPETAAESTEDNGTNNSNTSTTGTATATVDNLTLEQVEKAKKCAQHPLLTKHPETHRGNIYANPSHTAFITGYDSERSEETLQRLFRHTASDAFFYRHEYQDGDLILWDNRAVHHRGTGCPDDKPRKLVRTTAADTVAPIPVPRQSTLTFSQEL